VPLKQIKLSKSSIVFFLLAFAPAALILDFMDVNHILLFVVADVAIVPLAKLIGDSTEHLSFHYGPTAGSLLNVTFGNATEIIIAILAINSGLFGLVKASIIGSVLGNILLIFGLSIVVGGARFKEQSFSKENVGFQSSMLFLAIIGLAVPTILASVLNSSEGAAKIQLVSDALAFILLGVYILGIVFTFVTHKHLFVHVAEDKQGGSEGPKDVPWSKKRSILLLLASMAGVVAVSEVLVGSVEETGRELGFGQLFVGAIVVGIVGNAAEHSSAIMLARKGKIDLSIGIAAGSGTQVALFVVPILVIAGILLGQHFTLEFTLFELVTLFLAAIILNLIVHDGRSNWFEGAMLVAVYMIIAIGFFFL
jgi:Ca2+:H+ antiporter